MIVFNNMWGKGKVQLDKIILPLVLVFFLGLFVGNYIVQEEENNIEDIKNLTDISLSVGERIKIILKETPSTGCLWHFELSNSSIVKLISHNYVSDDNSTERKISEIIGGEGKHYWIFKGIKPGKVKISFQLYQEWKPDVIYKTKKYNVIVVSN